MLFSWSSALSSSPLHDCIYIIYLQQTLRLISLLSFNTFQEMLGLCWRQTGLMETQGWRNVPCISRWAGLLSLYLEMVTIHRVWKTQLLIGFQHSLRLRLLKIRVGFGTWVLYRLNVLYGNILGMFTGDIIEHILILIHMWMLIWKLYQNWPWLHESSSVKLVI